MDRSPPTLASEQIAVFASSRIGECKAERDVARDAIKSLNHVPVLFEDVGARPYPPRETYEPRLRSSQIFVGIYRDGYGEIASGMSISGLEDEFVIAREVGMPRLIYVSRRSTAREARLAKLIEEAKNDKLTIWFYDEPIELHERLRDDITAVVARTFHASRQIEAVIEEGAAKFLERLVPPSERVPRGNIERALIEELNQHHVVEVSGELGVGKTVLLAAAAAEQNWIFVNAQGNSPMQVAIRVANQLRKRVGAPPVIAESYEVATAAFRDAWQRSPRTVVAIDACPSAKLIDEVLTITGAPSSDYPMVFSLATPAEASGFHQFRVRPLDSEEVARIWLGRFGSRPTPNDLQRLMEVSRGIPLYLRYVRTPADVEIKDAALEAIELRRFQTLSALARDIVTYVCLSDRPLTLEDLVNLTGERQLVAAIEQASVMTVETPGGFGPAHQHLQTTIRAYLQGFPARHAYYAAQLGKRFVESADFSAAFFVFDRAGLPDASRVIARASFEAGQQGDYGTLVRLLRRRVGLLEGQGLSRQLCAVTIALAHAEDGAGEADLAEKRWRQAKTMAEQLGDASLQLRIRAALASRQALSVGSPDSIRELASLRDEVLGANEDWMGANIALDLSTIFLRLASEKEAAENATIAGERFAAIGDTYGAQLARRNLAAALSQVPERREEARTLAEEFTQADATGSKRMQAFKCNLLFMAARRRGENDAARALALEALALGGDLKDVWVIITNTINLANVERDLGKTSEALPLYDRVAQIAQNSGLRTTEAIASRHAAQVHNQTRNFELAKNYANHAAGLLRASAATVEFSIALEERGDAESGLGDRASASRTYLDAAKVLQGPDELERRARLISRAAVQYAESDERKRFFNDFSDFYSCAQDDPAATALALTEKLSGELPSRGIFGALNVLFQLMFKDLPLAISRHLFRSVSRRLLDASALDRRRSLAFVPLLAATPSNVFDLQMLAELADGLHGACGAVLSFKPSADLALNFVETVDFGRPVLISLSQLDDKAETAALATIIALFFLGFQAEILQNIFDSSSPKRTEVNITVIALSEATAANIPISLDADRNFGVTRPANFDEGLPTFVVFRDGLLETWEKEDYANGLLGLLAAVLLEVTFQLFQAEVESDTLARNIIRIVRAFI